MKQTDYTMRVIEAEAGHKLTQAAEVELLERTFTDKAYLAAGASADDWCEIPDAEAEAIMAEQRAAAAARQAEE